MSNVPQSIVVEQEVAGSPDDVWELWTTAAGMRRWWWSHWSDVEFEVHAVPGGSYRIEAPTAGIRVSGVYHEVERPHRLLLTWIWGDGDGDGAEELVEVTLRASPGGTTVSVRHSGAWDSPRPAEGYQVGWTEVLAALERVRPA